ncbi:tryptophan-rich sensory protein [Candidatus Saccharibacteria bacterium]|nr:tryptophan-rich sensory protein [Candidatus Saccharibacteria bacterium]
MSTNSTTDWYHALNKPSWAPVDNVFGIVWGLLYPIIIAVNIFVLFQVIQQKLDWRIGLVFWLNLAFNIAFKPIQFGLRNNYLTLIDIILILVTILLAMVAIWPHNRWVTVAFAPYFIWVSIATVLQFSITQLNH